MTDETNQAEIAAQALIETPQQVEALGSRMRLRILKAAAEPASVREIADRLGVPITRLYYHVNLLEEAGFLNIVDTRKSGARTEKIYRVAAHDFTPGPALVENMDDVPKAASALTRLVLDPARSAAETALARRLAGGELDGVIAGTLLDLTPEQAARFKARLEELVSEVGSLSKDPGAETRPYSLTAVLLPAD